MEEHQTGLGRLKQDGAETVGELREFLSSLKGKKPQEVMGVVANNGLVRNTLVATIAICLLLFVSSAGFYFLGGAEDESKTANKTANSAKTNTSETASDTKTTDTTTGQNNQSDTETKTGDNTLDTLGIGETKIADPNKNPLDPLDNLLDGER